MSTIPLGIGEYSRSIAKTAHILLSNMYVEKAPDNPVDGLMRLQRPGLAPFASVGSGASRGVFHQPGTFNGDYLAVQGSELYRITISAIPTLLGTIGGAGRVSFAASATRALFATGDVCYSTDGATITIVNVPDIDGVPSPISSVAYINGYFILTVAGSQHFFWLAPGDVDPDPLNFAAAENTPDNIVAGRRLFDELWFLGEASVEVWQTTGNLDAPFQRINGRLYEKGCANRDSIASTDNTLFWVGNDFLGYRAEQQPVRISDHSVEEVLRLNGASNLSGWSFAIDGHTFYCLTIGSTRTAIFDVENPTAWPAWKSYNRNTWRAYVGVQNGASVICGDDTTNDLWLLDPARSNDNGDPLIREVMGGVAVKGNKPVICANISIFAATGFAATNTNPVIELNWYDDGGQVLSGAWLEADIGVTGQYGKEVVLRQLGPMYTPGRLFVVRMTDDSGFRVSWMKMNEA